MAGKDDTKKHAKGRKGTLKDKTESWRKRFSMHEEVPKQEEGEEGEEEEVKEDDPETEAPEEKRSYGKARKFARMLAKGQVPEDIRRMYNEAATKSQSPRLFRTELINRMFKKGSNGEWVLCTDSADFQSWRSNKDIKFATAESVGVPYSIMLWQVFQGQEQAMKVAEQRGDIYCDNGMWHHKKVSTGRTKSTTEAMQLSGGTTAVDVDQFAAMNQWLGNRGWNKFGQQELEAPQGSSATKPGQLALADVAGHGQAQRSRVAPEATVAKLPWSRLEGLVGDAKAANERLQRDASRLVLKVRGQDGETVDKIKTAVAILNDSLSQLQECQMWQEVPGSNGNEKGKCEDFLATLAEKTEKANELLEQLKAVCKARGL